MDALSEILATMKLQGALFFRGNFSAPWYVSSPESQVMARALAPTATHLVIYHLLTEGAARLRTSDGTDVQLAAGDIVVFPHGHAHEMMSRDGTCRTEDAGVVDKIRRRDLTPLQVEGGGEPARFICGYMACDSLANKTILQGLPKVFTVNIRGDQSGKWLESAILHLLSEADSGSPGSQALLAKLSEALFVDTLRRHMVGLQQDAVGLLAGARDPLVGKSLAVLHARVRDEWTISSLAHEVGSSRSALADRFSRLLGMPPMSYLTRWRMQLAARALSTSSRATASIAMEVGYESEAAFSRAFKREYAMPPAKYRREMRQQAAEH